MNLNRILSAFLSRMGLSRSVQSNIWPTPSSVSMGDPSTSPSNSTPLLELYGLDVRMSRRSLLKVLIGTAAVATTVDIEQLLWVPKPIIVVPSLEGWSPVNMGQLVAATWEEYVGSIPTDHHIFDRHWLLENLK